MISSTTNPKIKLIRTLQSKRRERETRRQFVIEGVRLAEEITSFVNQVREPLLADAFLAAAGTGRTGKVSDYLN